MKRYGIILLALLALPLLAKDPMGRGKSAFNPGRSYPQVDISGYEELEYNSLDQYGEPEKYQNTTEYTSLPASVKVYDGLRHRRLIDLEGQINEKLYVRYKISQDPDLPQETDIYVEYDRFSVYFGKYDAYLTNGSLFSLNKNIDGLHMDYLGDNFELEGIYGEERSHEREFSFYGTGQREYSLGQTNIAENTLKVRLNGEELSDSAYRVDYFDGKIIFNNILSALDRVEGSYEYLDPIEDFLPIASKIRLSGIQHRYRTYRGTEPVLLTANAVYQYVPEEHAAVASPLETLQKATHLAYVDGSLRVQVNADRLQAVYFYMDEQQRIPLPQDGGLWTGNFPAPPTRRMVEIEYDLDGYLLRQPYVLEFSEQAVTAAVAAEAPEGTEETEETALPEWQEMARLYTLDAEPLEQYAVGLPEGWVFFKQTKFRRGSHLTLVFQPQAELALEQVRAGFKDDTLLLTRQDDGYHLDKQLTDSDALGENNLFLILDYGNAQQERRKVPFVIDHAAVQQRELTKLQLTEFPIISFTEKVYLSGALLAHNQDYRINYNTGVVTFLQPLPAETRGLKIDYVYRQTQTVQEVLKGAESQGPYKLANQLIVPESLTVMVNNLLLLNGADYKLEAATGRISFARKIHAVDTIQVSYKYNIVHIPPESQKKEKFSLSSFFVQEQAKSAEGGEVDVYTLSVGEFTITANLGVVTINVPIKYMPMSGGSLEVYDGSAQIPVDAYLVSKNRAEYNGLIVVSGNYTSASDLSKFRVTFEQSKTTNAPKAYFSGNNQTTTILDEIISNLPRPIVYESMILEVKTKTSAFYTPLIYKQDYIVGYREDLTVATRDASGKAVVRENFDAWQRGIITFITGNLISGYDVYSGFAPEDQFRLTYKISDAESTDPGDILHQTYGAKFSYSPTDWLRTEVEYNESRKQYQRSAQSAALVVSGNDLLLDGTIRLGDDTLEVVEDSEKVYINDRLQIKNDQYSISYRGGLIRFHSGINFNPLGDVVRVEYQYYTSGVGEQEDIMERASAAKVDATMSLGRTDITAAYITVNAQYDPVGNPSAAYPAGTEAKSLIINSRPTDRLQVYSRLEQQDNLLSQPYADDQTQERFQNTVLQNYKAAYAFNARDNIALAYNRVDAEVPGAVLDDMGTNSRQQDYQMDLNFGPDNVRTGVYLKNAESFLNNYDDTELSEKIFNRNARLTNFFRPLKDLSFTSSYIRNIDDKFKVARVLNESHAYTELIRYNPWTIDSSFEYSGSDYISAQSVSDSYAELTRSIGQDRRQVFNLTFRRPPELKNALYEELYLHYDHTYANRSTDLYQQAPDISRLNNFNFALRPYDLFSLSYDDRYNYGLLENYNRRDYYQENVYKFSRFYPLKYFSALPADFLIVNKIEYSKKTNENTRAVQSGDTLSTYVKDDYHTLLQSYSLNPLDQLTMALDFTNKNIERLSDTRQTKGSAVAESLEPENTQVMDLHYAQPGLLGLSNIDYAWKLNAAQKRIGKRNIDLNGVTTYTKDDLDSGTNLMTLVYNYWGSFTNTHYLQTLEEYKRKTGEGSRYSYGQTDRLNIRYGIPYLGINLTYGLTHVYNNQFVYLTDMISREALTRDRYHEKLLRYDDTQQYMIDYTLFPKLIMDGSLYFRRIDQQLVSRNQTAAGGRTKGTISSKSYELGISYRPLSDLVLRYGWRQNIFDLGYGEESRFTADYKPLKFSFGELSYKYENIFTYGKGTNDPQQEDSLNSSNGFVQTAVVDRDDIKVLNTLIFKVDQSISNIIIDNMVIDINLTRMHFWDKINSGYSYSLNAFYAKGTINF